MTLPNSYDTFQESSCQKSPSSWIHYGVEFYLLKCESINRVSSARLTSRNGSPNSVLLKNFFLGRNGLLFGCFNEGLLLLLLPLPPLQLSRRPGFSRFVEATVSRCMPEGLTFVSTLIESCEPYSLYSTVGMEDSKYILSKFSSFLRNFEP